MNPDIQFLLDEMLKRFNGYDAKLSQRLVDYDSKQEQRLLDHDECLNSRLSDFDAKWMGVWDTSRPYLPPATLATRIWSILRPISTTGARCGGIVDDIRLHVSKLSKIYERMIMTTPIIMSGVLTPSLSSVAARPPTSATMAVPSNGHCGEFYAGTMVLELLQL